MNSDAEIKRKAAEILFIVFACIVCIAVLVMLRPDAFFPSKVFINESDSTQTIELKVNSRLNSLIPRTASALSGGRLLGKQVGLFELKTEGAVRTGEFIWMKGPACCRPAPSQTLILRPTVGEEWSVMVRSDGSFEDSRGTIWRLKTE